MDLNRLAAALSCLGAFVLAVGIFTWVAYKPNELPGAYYQCLWSSTYQASREQAGYNPRRNPYWDPNQTDCKQTEPPLPTFRSPPFLNGIGLAFLVLGGLVFVSRKTNPQ